MLRKCALVVIMLLLPLVAACASAADKVVPTPGSGTPASKSSPAQSSSTTPEAGVARPQRGGSFTLGMGGEAGELDPANASIGVTRRVARLLFNTLVQLDKDGNIVPELADSWSYPDPKTLTLKLRKDVKFHDGTEFNAEAVKFNIGRLLGNPATDPYQGNSSWARGKLSSVSSVDVVDGYTVKFNLKAPQASLLGNLALMPVASMFSPTAVKKWDKATNTHPVGTGPFEFVEWVKDDHLTVKRFDGYWRKDEYGDQLPYLDQITVKPIPDSSVMLTNLRTGNVDLMDSVLPAQLPTLEGDKNLKSVRWGDTLFDIFLNEAGPPFDNKALRQAVAWAVDREAIAKSIYGVSAIPAEYELLPQHWAFDSAGKFYARDLAKAKEKLAEGGKPGGFQFVLKAYNTPLELRVVQAIKAQLAEAGIDMEIDPLEERQMDAERISGNFAAATYKGGAILDPDEALYTWYYSKSPSMRMKYYNPEVDQSIEKARVTYDQGERKALYAKVQALLLDDSPVIWLVHNRITTATRQSVMGFTPNMDLYHLQWDWVWLKK